MNKSVAFRHSSASYERSPELGDGRGREHLRNTQRANAERADVQTPLTVTDIGKAQARILDIDSRNDLRRDSASAANSRGSARQANDLEVVMGSKV